MARPKRESNGITKTLADNLSDLMNAEQQKTGLTQAEICEKIGVASGSYSEWAADAKTPTVDKIALVASYFDVSIDWLLGMPGGTRTKNSNARSAILYTGLSETSIETLHSLELEPSICDTVRKSLDRLLSIEEFENVLLGLHRLREEIQILSALPPAPKIGTEKSKSDFLKIGIIQKQLKEITSYPMSLIPTEHLINYTKADLSQRFNDIIHEFTSDISTKK